MIAGVDEISSCVSVFARQRCFRLFAKALRFDYIYSLICVCSARCAFVSDIYIHIYISLQLLANVRTCKFHQIRAKIGKIYIIHVY